MEVCEVCGEIIDEGYKFCSSCGSELKSEDKSEPSNEVDNIASNKVGIIEEKASDTEVRDWLQEVPAESHELSVEKDEAIEETNEIEQRENNSKLKDKHLLRVMKQKIFQKHFLVIFLLFFSILSIIAASLIKNSIHYGEAGGGDVSQYYSFFRNENYIYYGYTNNDRKNEFRKYYIDTGKIKTIDDTLPLSMESKDGWIYYVDGLSRSIYKIKEDGTGKVNIIHGLAMDLVLYKNIIYYRGNMDNHELWKVSIDGKGQKKISDDILTYHIVGNKIYYSSAKNYGSVYRCNLDGSHNVKICKINGEFMYVEKGYIYYKDIDDKELENKDEMRYDSQGLLMAKGKICRVNLKGQKREVLYSENIIGGFNIVNNKIYYDTANGDQLLPWVMDLDGKHKTKLIEHGVATYIRINSIIKFDNDTKEYYITDLDGKNKKNINKLIDNINN